MAKFTAINTPIADANPGQTIRMEAAVAAADAQSAGTWHIMLRLYRVSNNQQIIELPLYDRAITQQPVTVWRNYTLPNNLALGQYKALVTVHPSTWAPWQSVAQTAAFFDVEAVEPAPQPEPPPPPPPAPAIVLYGTHSPKLTLLKPDRDGFLPDDGRSYTLIDGASDEFDGSSLNYDKWWRRYRDNGGTLNYYNDELQRYIDNHVVSGGQLHLIARPKPGTQGHAPSASGIQYPFFDSGMIRSRTTVRRGYFEARIKLPPGLGVWAADWILSDDNRPCEIDTMEYVRNGVNEHADMIHGGNVHSMTDNGVRWRDDKYNEQYSYWRAWGLNQPNYFVEGYHTFSTLWERDQLINYVDGHPVVQRKIEWKNGGVEGGLASVILNLAIGGSWPTNNWTTPVPTDEQRMLVDYVRVSQRSDEIDVGTSPI